MKSRRVIKEWHSSRSMTRPCTYEPRGNEQAGQVESGRRAGRDGGRQGKMLDQRVYDKASRRASAWMTALLRRTKRPIMDGGRGRYVALCAVTISLAADGQVGSLASPPVQFSLALNKSSVCVGEPGLVVEAFLTNTGRADARLRNPTPHVFSFSMVFDTVSGRRRFRAKRVAADPLPTETTALGDYVSLRPSETRRWKMNFSLSDSMFKSPGFFELALPSPAEDLNGKAVFARALFEIRSCAE